jgi:hypothetical protein
LEGGGAKSRDYDGQRISGKKRDDRRSAMFTVLASPALSLTRLCDPLLKR